MVLIVLVILHICDQNTQENSFKEERLLLVRSLGGGVSTWMSWWKPVESRFSTYGGGMQSMGKGPGGEHVEPSFRSPHILKFRLQLWTEQNT